MKQANESSLSLFEPVANRRAFEEILLQLEAAISAGHLSAGDRLPAERDLAARFEVSRTSVREALRVLETLGVVSVRRGAENGAVLMRRPGNAFATTMGLLLALEHVSLANVVEFRVMVESWAARRLTEHRDDRVLRRLEELAAETPDQATFPEIDEAFHRTLVHASGNDLIDLIVAAADGVLSKLISDLVLVSWDWETSSKRLAAEHQGICKAIAAGDAERAATLAAEHIRYWGDLLSEASVTPGAAAVVTHRDALG